MLCLYVFKGRPGSNNLGNQASILSVYITLNYVLTNHATAEKEKK